MSGNSNSGRRAQPTALKLLRGNPGKRPLNDAEPRYSPTAPDCPDWLHKLAKEMWAWIVPQLEAAGVVASVDLFVLAALCQSWARWQTYERVIDERGPTYEALIVLNENGRPVDADAAKIVIKKRPEVDMAKAEKAAMLNAASRLGLDPTMRSKVMAWNPEKGTGAPSLLDAR